MQSGAKHPATPLLYGWMPRPSTWRQRQTSKANAKSEKQVPPLRSQARSGRDDKGRLVPRSGRDDRGCSCLAAVGMTQGVRMTRGENENRAAALRPPGFFVTLSGYT